MPENISSAPGRLFSRANLWTAAQVALALILIWLVLSQITLQDMVALWQRIELVWLLPTAASFFIIVWANARRSWLLIGRTVPFHSFLSVVVLQMALTNLVASTVGAASYVAQLRLRHQVNVGRGLGSVILSRWGDFASLLPTLIVSSILLWNQLGILQGIVIALCALLVLYASSVPLVILWRKPVSSILQRLLRPFAHSRFGSGALRQVDQLALLDSSKIWTLMRGLVISSLWVLAFNILFSYFHARLFALPLPLETVVYVMVLVLLISYLPFQVFGGLGVYELSAAYLYTLFGLETAQAVAVVLGTRVLLIGLSGISLLYLPIESRLFRAPVSDEQPITSRAVPEGGAKIDSTT